MWIYTDNEIVALQNRSSDLWEEDPSPENHEQYIAAANRLLGALEMMYHSAHYQKNALENVGKYTDDVPKDRRS